MEDAEHEVYGQEIPADGEDVDMGAAGEEAAKLQELDEMKRRFKEMEEEAAALREMQAKVAKEMQGVDPNATSSENKEEMDARSVFAGNPEAMEATGKKVVLTDLVMERSEQDGIGPADAMPELRAADVTLPSIELADLGPYLLECISLSNRRNVQQLRSVCWSWRSALPCPNGPWLLMSRKEPVEGENILMFRMLASHGIETIMRTNFMQHTPPMSICWGAAHGTLALSHNGGASLMCLTCAELNELPAVSEGCTPNAIFFKSWRRSRVRALAILSDDQQWFPRLHEDIVDDTFKYKWEGCGGFDDFAVNSVGFWMAPSPLAHAL